MIAEGLLKAVCVVECSSSVYRKTIPLSLDGQDIELPLKDFLDRVVISAIIYANNNILNFHDDDFVEDYLPYSFEIDKYDILASDDGISFTVDMDEQLDDKISSIFIVVKSEDNDEIMTVKLTKRKIEIDLPEQQYGVYYAMKSTPEFENLFFSIIAIPALGYALGEIKNGSLEDAQFKYNWFKSIEKTYEAIKPDKLDQNHLSEISPLELAQEIMNFGTSKALTDIYDLFTHMTNHTVGDMEND